MACKTTAERLGVKNQQDAFPAVLRGQDTLGVVVRSHIHLENQVIEFIKVRLSPPEALDAMRLGYDRSVKLALALGLSDEFKSALNFIGKLRNNFAHTLDATIDDKIAAEFEAAMGTLKDIAQESYSAHSVTPIGRREPLDRVIVYVVTLWSGILHETIKARSGHQALKWHGTTHPES
jgi:hypothetical protein